MEFDSYIEEYFGGLDAVSHSSQIGINLLAYFYTGQGYEFELMEEL